MMALIMDESMLYPPDESQEAYKCTLRLEELAFIYVKSNAVVLTTLQELL